MVTTGLQKTAWARGRYAQNVPLSSTMRRLVCTNHARRGQLASECYYCLTSYDYISLASVKFPNLRSVLSESAFGELYKRKLYISGIHGLVVYAYHYMLNVYHDFRYTARFDKLLIGTTFGSKGHKEPKGELEKPNYEPEKPKCEPKKPKCERDFEDAYRSIRSEWSKTTGLCQKTREGWTDPFLEEEELGITILQRQHRLIQKKQAIEKQQNGNDERPPDYDLISAADMAPESTMTLLEKELRKLCEEYWEHQNRLSRYDILRPTWKLSVREIYALRKHRD